MIRLTEATRRMGYPYNLAIAVLGQYTLNNDVVKLANNINKCYYSMSEREKLVIDYLYRDNKTYGEISDIMKLAPSSLARIKVMVNRKLQNLSMRDYLLSDIDTLDEYIINKGLSCSINIIGLKARTISALLLCPVKINEDKKISTIGDIQTFISYGGELNKIKSMGRAGVNDILNNEYIKRMIDI